MLQLARERLFLLEMTKKGQKFGLKMGIFLGLYLKKDHRKKFRVENRKFFGKYLKKQVIGNLAYPEMLFTKKPCPRLNAQGPVCTGPET